ncbi:MAG TPA: sigma 54-interacting transcriptional regulator [Bacteroidota bacterium]|nr:sigma 54-interacting transcriptional regulator [Bacteroidota bacterium]
MKADDAANRFPDELGGLRELAELLGSGRQVEDVLAGILAIALRTCSAKYVSIMLLNPATRETMKTLARQQEGGSAGIDHVLNQLLAGWMIDNRRPLRAPSIREGIGLPGDDRGHAYGPIMSVPLIVGGELTGVLNLARESGGREFPESALCAAAIIAQQSALFIHQRKIVDGMFEENKRLKQVLDRTYAVGDIVARSEKMKKLLGILPLVARSSATVLLQGETGTGKELFARFIHRESSRAGNPFVPINCAAIPGSLIESELFGHERGAFTGAVSAMAGKFELAEKGTIFLDEISEMPAELQAKLLRVLEERKLFRLGSPVERAIDVRVIAATNRDLAELVTEKKFREDLFYRLNVMPVTIPPLRERRDDIPALAQHFLDEYSHGAQQFDDSALDVVSRAEWRGNVRELRNIVERISLLVASPAISSEALRAAGIIGGSIAYDGAEHERLYRALIARHDGGSDLIEEIESHLVEFALRDAGGCAARAARLLGIDRKALERRREKYHLS